MGYAAMRDGSLTVQHRVGMVGARGFEPAVPTLRIVVPYWVDEALRRAAGQVQRRSLACSGPAVGEAAAQTIVYLRIQSVAAIVGVIPDPALLRDYTLDWQTHAARAADAGLEEGTVAWDEWVKDYQRHVETYDWVDVADRFLGLEALFHRNRARAVRRLVDRFGAPPYLDAGCGTGLNLRNLPPGSTGLDINPRNVAILRARFPAQLIVEGDLDALPFPEVSFATVVCTEVLEHVPSAERALVEIRRVLIRGGRLVGTVPARSPIWRLRFLSSTCPRSEPFHNEYTLNEVRKLLTGWRIERIGYSLLHFNVVFVASR